MKEIKNSYLPSIDLLKFICSIIIVLFHAYKLEGTTINCIFPLGYVMTEVFFVISGILMAQSVYKDKSEITDLGKDTWKFILHKVGGIITQVYVAFIFNFIVRQILLDANIIEVIKELTLSIEELSFTYMAGINLGRFYNGPSWYISAMLLAMFVTYPFFRKYKNVFSKIVAPIIAIGGYAYLNNKYERLNFAYTWDGICVAGFLRGLCGICLGIACFGIINKLRKYKVTRLAKVLCGITELALLIYILLIASAWEPVKGAQFSYLSPFLGAMMLILMFSGYAEIHNKVYITICKALGKYSLALYLNHRIWIYVLVSKRFNHWSYQEKFTVYIIASVITAFVAMLIAALIKKYGGKLWSWLRSKLVVSECETNDI